MPGLPAETRRLGRQANGVSARDNETVVRHVDAAVVFYPGIHGSHADSPCNVLRRKIHVADDRAHLFGVQNFKCVLLAGGGRLGRIANLRLNR